MDTATNPAPPVPPITSRVTEPDRKRILFIMFGLIALIAIGYGAYRFWGGAFLPRDHALAVASDSLPLQALQTIDLSDGTLISVTIEEQGTAVLIDAADADDTNYYLIGDPSFTRVNLYRKEAGKEGLAELTHSGTAKYDLTIDAESNSAAYMSVTDGTSHITVWKNAKKDEEKDLGPGNHPVILPGGFFVIAEREGKIVSIEIESGEAYELVSSEPNSPFAVDQENLKIAIYEPVTRTLQEYSIEGLAGASYIGSMPLSYVPRELTYVDGVPNALVANGKVLNFGPADALTEYPNVPFGFADGRKLTTYHD